MANARTNFNPGKAFFLSLTLCLSLDVIADYQQNNKALLAGNVMAVAYSGFREGQHPDRGKGAVNPSEVEIREDLDILAAQGFRLIRLYDSGENSALVLRLIEKHNLPIKVVLGAWLDAELSNHEACSWLDKPIMPDVLKANILKNSEEIERVINLARSFEGIVVAVNVGNEALVSWNDHMVSVGSVIGYVRRVKQAVIQPVTVADNYEWWIQHGAALADELDFIGVHTYPVWENQPIEDGLDYTVENIERVHQALPDHPIVILEAGWASIAEEFGIQANEKNQARYFNELKDWAINTNTTIFFFEAFDEPWKGNPEKPLGAEKHWGLFNVDRTPKLVMRPIQMN
jgi:exo-beta-1,3-glucanase (GH17 family)